MTIATPPAVPAPSPTPGQPAPVAPRANTSTNPLTTNPGPALTTIGAALISLTVFLPWATTVDSTGQSFTETGFAAPDGIYFIILGIILAAIAQGRRQHPASATALQWLALPVSLYAGYAAIADVSHMLHYIQTMHANTPYLGGYIGIGPSAVVLGAVLASIGAFIPNTTPLTRSN